MEHRQKMVDMRWVYGEGGGYMCTGMDGLQVCRPGSLITRIFPSLRMQRLESLGMRLAQGVREQAWMHMRVRI